MLWFHPSQLHSLVTWSKPSRRRFRGPIEDSMSMIMRKICHFVSPCSAEFKEKLIFLSFFLSTLIKADIPPPIFLTLELQTMLKHLKKKKKSTCNFCVSWLSSVIKFKECCWPSCKNPGQNRQHTEKATGHLDLSWSVFIHCPPASVFDQ